MLALLALLVLAEVAVRAAYAPRAAHAAPAGRTVAGLEAQALGSDAEQALAAIAELAERGATVALRRVLEAGRPDAHTDRILEAFAGKPDPRALEALLRVAAHRRPAARVLALRALAALAAARPPSEHGPVTDALVRGLGDSDARVRGESATALGERYAARPKAPKSPPRSASPEVVTALLIATERGVPEASRAAAHAISEADLPRLHAALSKQPIQAALDASEVLLTRPALSEGAKFDVIARLGELASPAVRVFLEHMLAEHKVPAGSPIARVIADTAKRIDLRPAAARSTP